jgi:hypothetical protein
MPLRPSRLSYGGHPPFSDEPRPSVPPTARSGRGPPSSNKTDARSRPFHTWYFSRSSTLRTFPDTVIGKESRIWSLLGIL